MGRGEWRVKERVEGGGVEAENEVMGEGGCVESYVSWCGGESWVDQRVPRAYIHHVALLL